MFDKIYSPVQKLECLNISNLFVKRDDLIDPFISGNKWRKLKYILADAEQQNKTHLVTFGGSYSNHLLATAAASSRLKMNATAFVRGEAVKNEMLLLCGLFGMKLIFVDMQSFKNKPALFNQYFGEDPSAYFIDEGGASEAAVLGCQEIIAELNDTYDHIFCAAGTGTTAAGLLNGINNHKLKTKLNVIPVLNGGNYLQDEVLKYASVDNNLVFHNAYHFGGYAKTTPALIDFIKAFTRQTGVLIDPVYTAKMFYAIQDLANKDYFNPDDKILAIHTGGLMGIFGMANKF